MVKSTVVFFSLGFRVALIWSLCSLSIAMAIQIVPQINSSLGICNTEPQEQNNEAICLQLMNGQVFQSRGDTSTNLLIQSID